MGIFRQAVRASAVGGVVTAAVVITRAYDHTEEISVLPQGLLAEVAKSGGPSATLTVDTFATKWFPASSTSLPLATFKATTVGSRAISRLWSSSQSHVYGDEQTIHTVAASIFNIWLFSIERWSLSGRVSPVDDTQEPLVLEIPPSDAENATGQKTRTISRPFKQGDMVARYFQFSDMKITSDLDQIVFAWTNHPISGATWIGLQYSRADKEDSASNPLQVRILFGSAMFADAAIRQGEVDKIRQIVGWIQPFHRAYSRCLLWTTMQAIQAYI